MNKLSVRITIVLLVLSVLLISFIAKDCRKGFVKKTLTTHSLDDSHIIPLKLKYNDLDSLILLYGNNMGAWDTLYKYLDISQGRLDKAIFKSLYNSEPLEVNERCFESFRRNDLFIKEQQSNVDRIAKLGKSQFLKTFVSNHRFVSDYNEVLYISYYLYKWNTLVSYDSEGLYYIEQFECE